MADVSNIAHLIHNQIHGELTAPQEQELKAWLQEDPKNQQFVDNEATPANIRRNIASYLETDESRIRQKLGIEPADQPSKLFSLRMRYAAAAIIFLCAGSTWLLWPKQQDNFLASRSTFLQKTMTPAIRLDMDTTREGELHQWGRWRLIKQHTSQFALWQTYSPYTTGSLPDSVPINFTVPNGQSWRVTLPDRSIVDLNAGSSLSFYVYPKDSVQGNRQVSLTGEARFHITPDINPFVVETPRGEIEVLGTTFIVSDYKPEDKMHIIQLSGKTRIRNGKTQVNLKAGERLDFDAGSKTLIPIPSPPIADSDYRKSDLFDFSEETLPKAMEEIRKCYGMAKVVIRKDVDTSTIGKLSGGTMTRDLPLPTLLEMLTTENMKFSIQGRNILVYK